MIRSRSLRAGLVLAAALAGCAPGAARTSFDLVRYEATCPSGEREARSLRQTVILLDEALVTAGEGEAAQRLTRMVVEAADARDAPAGTLGTRERLTLLVARRDGSEIVPLFVGCSPNISADEVGQRKAQDSALDRFVWGGTDSRVQKARTDYATAIARALAQLRKQAGEIAAEPLRPGSIVTALGNAGRLADPELGLPRFVVLSPFAVVEAASLKDVPSARKAGFDLAERAGVDFGRAEVYLGGTGAAGGLPLEAARAFVLGSRGNLVAARSDSLPRFAPEPVTVAVFSGFLDNVGRRTPMQMRLAQSATGELVNSWVETTVSRPVATPLDGKAICRGAGQCEIQGRDRFARVWLLDPQGEPADRSAFPYGGARNIDVKVAGASATGAISDPKIFFRAKDDAGQADQLRFELQRVDGGRF